MVFVLLTLVLMLKDYTIRAHCVYFATKYLFVSAVEWMLLCGTLLLHQQRRSRIVNDPKHKKHIDRVCVCVWARASKQNEWKITLIFIY